MDTKTNTDSSFNNNVNINNNNNNNLWENWDFDDTIVKPQLTIHLEKQLKERKLIEDSDNKLIHELFNNDLITNNKTSGNNKQSDLHPKKA